MVSRDSISVAGQRSVTGNSTAPRSAAYSGLVEQRDRWRHPEQFIEEKLEFGWREATVEEITNED